ncbi:MAG TPA: hypothetical protein DEP45_00900 [Armatimonadetes bacterium]|nr:hypothetical protein [Armatimonadota bacterium]
MRSIYAAGLIALLMAPCAQAQTISRSTLGNGLTVLAWQSDHAQVAGIAAVVGASGAHESNATRGSRALLQQMLSIASHDAVVEKLSPISGVVGPAGSAGLGVNTNFDFVEAAYAVSVEELDEGLALFADQLFEVELTEEDLDQSRDLTVRSFEAAQESPVQVTFDLFRAALYGDSAMAQPQQGDPESLEAITLADLQSFRDTYYVPSNTWLCIVSPLRVEEASAAVSRAFGGVASRPAPPAAPEPVLPSESLVEVGDSPALVQASLVIGVPLPSCNDPIFPAAEVLTQLLEGPGGRLHRDLHLLTALGLALPTRLLDEHYPINVLSVQPARDPFLAVHTLAAPRAIEAARAGVLRHIFALRTGAATEDELARAKARVINAHRLSTQRPSDTALYLARRSFFGLAGADEAIAAVEAVTSEDLNAVAKQYFGRHAVGIQMPSTQAGGQL